MKSLPWPYPGYRAFGRNQEILDHRSNRNLSLRLLIWFLQKQVVQAQLRREVVALIGSAIVEWFMSYVCHRLFGSRSGSVNVLIIAKTCLNGTAVQALFRATPDPGMTE